MLTAQLSGGKRKSGALSEKDGIVETLRLRGGEDEDDELAEDDNEEVQFVFTQQAPEMSQPILPVKKNERTNLDSMGSHNRNKAILDLSRVILFKALAGEPIDRLKCIKEALGGSNDRISSALMEEVTIRLRNVFGFELRRIPKFMEKSVPKKYADRIYVLNEVQDGDAGNHSKAIHSQHAENAIEKAFLMCVLAYVFCKGDPRADGSRWITDIDLYRLLHGQDENLPEEPSNRSNRKSSSHSAAHSGTVSGDTPNVDAMLDKFVYMDYLLKQKQDPESASQTQALTQAEDVFLYAMGPRAAMEIGRRQVVSFCAEILNEEPDPTMLAEIAQDEGETQMEEEEE